MTNGSEPNQPRNRRDFFEQTAATAVVAIAGWQLNNMIQDAPALSAAESANASTTKLVPNMIGAYGPWAAGLVRDQAARFSFRNARFHDLEAWRRMAKQRVRECLAPPEIGPIADVRVDEAFVFDRLHVERLSWQLPYGPRTKAIFLKPEGASGRLPAVLGLHDHGGLKYFGHEKITRVAENIHPIMTRHQHEDYGNVAWANELAKRGYAVLVHDTFTFGSRRVLMEDVPPAAQRGFDVVNDDSEESVTTYNRFAAEHEHLLAKSLFCAGTTWPGVFIGEDQRALDYLCGRPDVDSQRVGCAGLSGGGLRTVYLGGTDDRIRCACCVGMMTTWRDYLLNKCHTHTWMIYIPLLPLDLDYAEVLGLRVPMPTMVLNNNEDPLFTLPEMQRADRIMAEIFEKANAVDRYRCSFYPGPHKFDVAMQKEAFDWFDQWLKA
jgi:dienelactone hydrolase